MKRLLGSCAIFLLCLAALPLHAKDAVQTGEIKKAGFGVVADTYNKMDAGQKRDVRRQAFSVEKKLEKMSKRDRAKLEKQLKKMAKSLGVKDFDVSRIDTKKKVSIRKARKDFRKYDKMMNKKDGVKPFKSKH